MQTSAKIRLSAMSVEGDHLYCQRQALQALAQTDFRQAFHFADRRCRMPMATLSCLVLRAEALWSLGQHDAALADLAVARGIDPSDVAANQRLFRWSGTQDRLDAARTLLARDPDADRLWSYVLALRAAGKTDVAAVTVLDTRIIGWATWANGAPLLLTILNDGVSQRTEIAADPFHRFAAQGIAAAWFEVHRPRSASLQRIEVSAGDSRLFVATVPPNAGRSIERQRCSRPAPAPSLARGATPSATVIIPIYADPEGTAACLESLLGQLPSPSISRVILVDDAAPDPRVKALIATAARNGYVTVVENPVNLGFVGAVNRALSTIETGDVVLLNADTVVPPRFVERLAAVAHGAPTSARSRPFPTTASSRVSPPSAPRRRCPTGSGLPALTGLLPPATARPWTCQLASGSASTCGGIVLVRSACCPKSIIAAISRTSTSA
ncbi:MAG: glycosyltransferase family 2 protein [Methylacidiphilales bacterium]|nr:glycosyltransferase family 2 protein [Candidatus Methylacidiphilales bacterium]